jgi:protein Tex
MILNKTIASNLNLPQQKVLSTIKLLKNDNTIPFIARYRKEATGNLDEEQIRNISEELQRLESLEKRRKTVLQRVCEQGKLTETLRSQITQADTITTLEDLYQPFRPKRSTRAMIAREKGLEPLADLIIQQILAGNSLEAVVEPFINDEVPNLKSAIEGSSDIVAEIISENAVVRKLTREKGFNYGKLISNKNEKSEDKLQKFTIYYQFELAIKFLKPHQILAINRGENEDKLRISIFIHERHWRSAIQSQYPVNKNSILCEILEKATEDCAKRLLLPSIQRDIRRMITEQAENHAINVFAQNLKALLSQPPVFGHVILAIDPGFRTGSKIVVVDPTGKLLDTATIYPHSPQNNKQEANQILETLIDKHQVTLIVIGNGTASRETEVFIAEITKKNKNLHYCITSEAGASVYSASKLARKEFPDLDVSIRGAISIARRVQDPLAELVKIDPKSIGVGLYQHDLNQTKLSEVLEQVVETVVNTVGVEINTASASLLSHVAGIGPNLAHKIVHFREENGPFTSRKGIKEVPGMGPKTYEQSAGFLRIRDGINPLDATAIHPESYPIASSLLKLINFPNNSSIKEQLQEINHFKQHTDMTKLAESLNTGLHTLDDILKELAHPGRDPREDLPKPILRKDVLCMEDISQGMRLRGTIRNVVDFGAFVDIGVKTDGLLHRSKIKKGTTLKVGEVIDVIILSIDRNRNRISLDMKERPN